VLDAGSNLNLSCTSYPDDSAVSGVAEAPPDASPISPVVVTSGPVTPPPTTPSPTTPSPTTPSPTPQPGFALTGPYELYCPETPVGNIALNDVTTTASIPTVLAVGQSFEASDFQTQLSLPASITAAAAALGNSAIVGTAVINVDAEGASPATVSAGDIAIDVPIPNPVPDNGLALNLPSPPGTVGPFTATGGGVTLSLDPTVQLTLVISGANLNLTCEPYPNDSASTGIVEGAPDASPISPVIAIQSGDGLPSTIPPTTTDPAPGPSTTVHPSTGVGTGSSDPSTGDPSSHTVVVANSSSLAFTGLGDVAQWVAIGGGALILVGFVLLVMTDTPRRILYRISRRARA